MNEKAEYQVFWNTGKPLFGQSGSRMLRIGNKIIIEIEDYDIEDSRCYNYKAEFSVTDYKKALLKSQEEEKVLIESLDGKSELIFRRERLDRMELTFTSNSKNNDFGGYICGGDGVTLIAKFPFKTKDLLLK